MCSAAHCRRSTASVPDQLNIRSLIDRVAGGEVKEIILAVNATVEGQTTAHYLTDLLSGLEH